MRRKRFGRWSLPLLLAVIFAAGVHAAGAQEIDSSAKSVAPRVESNTHLDRMLLLLQPGDSQQKAPIRRRVPAGKFREFLFKVLKAEIDFQPGLVLSKEFTSMLNLVRRVGVNDFGE